MQNWKHYGVVPIIVKKHITPDKRLILAICDKDILGKEFQEGNVYLDLSSDFYQGEEYTEEEIIKFMKSSYMLNLAGEKTIALAKKMKLITGVKLVQGIPYAQALIVI